MQPIAFPRRAAWPIAIALGLSACVAPMPVQQAPRPAAAPAPAPTASGLDRVMGHDARALEELFGEPDQDIHDQGARKLQFASSACVLDAYLYAKGGREPVVTWLDARLPTGGDFDRASCIAALSRRKEAR